MAFDTVRISCVNIKTMRLPMACFTIKGRLMLIHMTICTPELMMFCFVFLKIFARRFMATFTKRGWNILDVCNFHGHMRFVAAGAVLLGHFRGMRIMAFHASGGFMMLGVTFFAIEPGVFAGKLLHLASRFRMTGKTYRFDVFDFGEIHLPWIMRVVAGNAIIQLIVGFVLRRVTGIAFRDGVFSVGKVLLVTVNTTDLCLMERTPLVHFPNLFQMTLDTVFVGQLKAIIFRP